MAYEESGDSLLTTAASLFGTTAKENGIQEKIHELAYTTGYSVLIPNPAAGVGNPKMGTGVFYDLTEKNNKVYVVKPSSGALAGILIRQNYIKTGFPSRPDEVDPSNKALLMKSGYLKYKTGIAADGTTVQTFATVNVGWGMYISETTGVQHFAASDPATGYVKVGKVYRLNPEDKSFTVKIDV